MGITDGSAVYERVFFFFKYRFKLGSIGYHVQLSVCCMTDFMYHSKVNGSRAILNVDALCLRIRCSGYGSIKPVEKCISQILIGNRKPPSSSDRAYKILQESFPATWSAWER